jgi:outer membrane protein
VGLSALALTLVLLPVMSAQSAEKWTYTIGAGVGTAPDYEGGDDYEAVPIPVLRAQKGRRFATLFGLHAVSNVLDHPVLRLGPSVKYQPGYSDVDNNRVDSLNNRGGVFLGGAKGGYVWALPGKASLEAGLEVLYGGKRGGWLYTPFMNYERALSGPWAMQLTADTTFASQAYMSHFFGVNRSEALSSGLDEQDADASFKDVGLTGLVSRRFGTNWSGSVIAQYKRMVGDAEDSPIVDDEGEENQFFGGVVVSYTFD